MLMIKLCNRYIMVAIALIAFYVTPFAQTNLVPNFSFEDYVVCPSKYNKPPPPPWYLATNDAPIYLNACDVTNYAGVPFNITKSSSYQFANSGLGYVYLDLQNGGSRAYLQTKMLDSLKKEHYYYVEEYVNAPNPMKYACNNIGILFTETALYVDTIATPYGLLAANPQVVGFGNPVIKDTLNWIKIAAIFKAKGGEKYLTLGNFKNNANTAFVQIQPTGYGGAGYFIDDVAVYDLDSFHLQADAGRDTTIAKGDSVFIGSYTNGIDTIKWLQNGTTVKDTTRPGFWIWPTANTFYVLTQTVGGFTSSDTVYINVSTLPVKFISFSATLKENKVENSWQTANEINVNSYLIEKSTDGKSFYRIGKLAAENKARNSYAFTDENVSEGVSYYRVLGLDNDGRKTYSGVQRVENNYRQKALVIYPNPANDLITIKASSIKAVTIINTEGKVVYSEKANNNTATINISSLPKGIYLVKGVLENNTVVSEKLIKE